MMNVVPKQKRVFHSFQELAGWYKFVYEKPASSGRVNGSPSRKPAPRPSSRPASGPV